MEDKTKEKEKERRIIIISIVVSTFAGLFIITHIIFPLLAIDVITVSLLIIALLPWLGLIFKKIDFPGGGGVEYREPRDTWAQLAQIKGLKETIDNIPSNSLTKEKNEISQILDNKEKEILEFRKEIQKYISDNTEIGSLSDYREWLDGFKKIGGTVLDYKMQPNFRLVEKEISIPALYGTLAYNFIVKNNGNVTLREGNPGHCGIYYFKNFAYEGNPPGSI